MDMPLEDFYILVFSLAPVVISTEYLPAFVRLVTGSLVRAQHRRLWKFSDRAVVP